MAVVVSDTTPLNYLILIDAVKLLPRLYARILVPAAVCEELSQPRTPEAVRLWMSHPPFWLEVISPASPPDPALSHLDAGEAQAIALALERRADLLLIDERDGTATALARGLTVTGTLGVLDRAAALGFVDLPAVFTRLRQTTFHCPVRLMTALLEDDAVRKQERPI
jgi:predicted nucleic acid-binding protein